ncbi:MAG: helix-turn-helix domain-containing protein [Chloroflexota bacterium]
MGESERAKNADAIITEVARRMGVPEERVRARDRTPQVTAARHAAFWALNRAGLNPAQIARLLRLNHSTMIHGLSRAEAHPEWRELVAPVVELSGVGGQKAALESWLVRGLSQVTPNLKPVERRAVRSYAICTLLGWERQPGSICAYGLWLMLKRPNVRGAVEEALTRCELAHEIGRIDLQAQRLGYRAAG